MENTINQNSLENDSVLEIEKLKIKEPSLYRVLLHNDDYTSMDFVVDILVQIFQKTIEEATQVMFSVHKKGIGICGVYSKEVAEFRVNKTIRLAREAGFPLLCTMEKE